MMVHLHTGRSQLLAGASDQCKTTSVLSEYALYLNTFFTAFLCFSLEVFLANSFVSTSTVPLLDKAKY